MARTKNFPFLWFANDAEGAARFYAAIFPDSHVDRVTSLQSGSPSGPPGSVTVVDFTLWPAVSRDERRTAPRIQRRRFAAIGTIPGDSALTRSHRVVGHVDPCF